MATVKVKLRPSSTEGKAGVIYYQITHNRKTQQITTRLRVCPSDWDAEEEKLVQTTSNRSMIQNRIDSDVALLRRVIIDIDSSGLRPELQHSQGMEGKGRGSILCEIPGLFRGCPVLLSALHGGCQVMFSLWHCYRLLSSRPNSPLAHDREKYILPLTLK